MPAPAAHLTVPSAAGLALGRPTGPVSRAPGWGRLVLPRADGRTIAAIFIGGALGTAARPPSAASGASTRPRPARRPPAPGRPHVPAVMVVIDSPERIATAVAVIDELTAEQGLVASEAVPSCARPAQGRPPSPASPGLRPLCGH